MPYQSNAKPGQKMGLLAAQNTT